MKLAKTSAQDFYRDLDTNAVINTNVAAYKLYKQQRSNRDTIESLREEIDNLKNLVHELIKNQK